MNLLSLIQVLPGVTSEADLLKKEILSLNQEMTQLLTRVKNAEKG